MKRLLLATSCALLFLSSTSVLADPGRGNDHRGGQSQHDRRGHDDGDHHDRRGHDQREHNGRRDNGRHLGQYKHDFRRGQHVPVVYLQQRYYVNDYRAYHLAPPRRGYRWVRPDDGRFLLVSTATGLIAEILLGR